MALFRALETAKGAHRRLFDDPFASAFLPAALQRTVRLSRQRFAGGAVERFIDWRWPGARSSGVARTRLIDDWLCDSIESGARQVVILGAGFDARAQRLADMTSTKIFEMDRDCVLKKKKSVLATAGANIHRVAFISTDFLHDDIARLLTKAGFEPKTKTVFLWEGVTNYLDCRSVCSVFHVIAGLAPPGSSVIFTYIHRGVLEGRFQAVGLSRLRKQLKRWGEAWTFGFFPDQLPAFLSERGFELSEDLGAAQYRERVYGRAIRFKGYEFYRVASAHLMTPIHTKEENRHAPRQT